MHGIILYFQEDCHLCDDAEVLLHQQGLGDQYEKVDIESDLELLKQYGIHVPVLKRSSDSKELFWPFDQAELNRFFKE